MRWTEIDQAVTDIKDMSLTSNGGGGCGKTTMVNCNTPDTYVLSRHQQSM